MPPFELVKSTVLPLVMVFFVPHAVAATNAVGIVPVVPAGHISSTNDNFEEAKVTGSVLETEDRFSAVGLCPGAGSCCGATGLPGCNNSACCNMVCNLDSNCCDIGWDAGCAELARAFCGDLCDVCPTTGDCCASHPNGGCEDALCCDLVCTQNASCCEAVWSQTCAVLAGQLCDQCEPVSECPRSGGCCVGPHTPGCEREGCCEIVCALDSFCCRGEWDSVCARKARDNCPNVCDCESFGEFDNTPPVDLRDVAGLFNCFTGSGGDTSGETCACSDYDGDGDSDLFDYAVFVPLLMPG